MLSKFFIFFLNFSIFFLNFSIHFFLNFFRQFKKINGWLIKNNFFFKESVKFQAKIFIYKNYHNKIFFSSDNYGNLCLLWVQILKVTSIPWHGVLTHIDEMVVKSVERRSCPQGDFCPVFDALDWCDICSRKHGWVVQHSPGCHQTVNSASLDNVSGFFQRRDVTVGNNWNF